MSTTTTHALPTIIDVPHWDVSRWDVSRGTPGSPSGLHALDDEMVRAAGHAARTMPAALHDGLVDLADRAPQAGAVVFRGLPVGDLPLTPDTPTSPTTKDRVSEFVLLSAARRLGQPVGYLPEHGGDLVQNLVPTRQGADRQVSTSSKVDLMFHTEAAFHPHRPRFLLLLCLRGNPEAVTTLSSIHEVLPLLPRRTVEVLSAPRFRTAVDESYLHGRQNVLGAPMAVLSGDPERPTLIFDADLMVGIDTEADEALQTLSAAVHAHHTGLALEPGDLLVVDNDAAVHGRTAYTPRYDGYDRWLQRAMAVTDLSASAGDRQGRVIVTHFGV